jgi:5-methylcytosine-specific restriction endonuclease McrA
MANMTPRAKRNRLRRLIDRDGLLCGICGQPIVPPEQPTIDHIVAKAEGGPNSFENLRLAHYRCNYDRHH